MATHALPDLQMVLLMGTLQQRHSIRTDNTPRSDDHSSNLCRSQFTLTEHHMVRRNVSMHDNLRHSLASTSAHSRSVAHHTVQVALRQH